MTPLSKPVSRETTKLVSRRPVIVTLAPGNGEALIGLRLKGTRAQYVLALSDVFRWAALHHGNKVAIAKRQARKNGVPWRRAKREFEAQNRLS